MHGANKIRAWEQRSHAISKEGSRGSRVGLFRRLPHHTQGGKASTDENSTCHSALSCRDD